MTLRDVTDDDLPIFFEHQQDPEANHMAAFPSRARDAFMIHWREKVLPEPSNRKQTIVVEGDVVGNIVSWEQEGKRLIGYWIGRAHWGRGFASAALAAFLEIETTRPLHAIVAMHNVGSTRVLEKCGFQREGGPTIAPDGVEEQLFRLDR